MNQTQLIQERYIKVDSIDTRYWSAGRQGTATILLDGAGGSIEVWTDRIQALARHHRAIAFDMVGNGLSDKPAVTYSLDYQLQFLRTFLDTLGIERANFIGNSMGATIALKLAIESPERVKKLGLVSCFGLGREINIYDRLLAAFPVIANLIPLNRSVIKMVLNSCVCDPKSMPEEWVELGIQRFNLPGQKEALISLLTTNLDFWGVRREVFSSIVRQLDRIEAPTLIIWGKQDRITPVSHAYVASQKIRNSSLYVFDRCGHWAQVEHPEKFDRLVSNFLAY
ncbi:MAG: alpha/beta fold hydrolase [Cyanosarcina radialis HA8281-LM2]|jgi:4,5:9,10-diseco-3-hydroxy-5,9,17-trioxoandrosta-1(10),2-diene-4-oate hydrolase|nr:alpha/beta fold hydrolase [Cyanosarcina radialis HA8281-LM2]